jgi:hypothetical protein
LAANICVAIMQNLKVSYDFRGIESSNELLCIKRFQKGIN